MRLLPWVVPPLLAAAGACSSGVDDGGGTLTVLAAASLRNGLEEVADRYEDLHPDVDVALSFDGSSALAAAIVEGAPADVLVAADEATMQRVVDAGRVDGEVQIVATNELQIAVAAGNPLGIDGLDDLDGASVALCQPQVPCGAYAARAFQLADLPPPVAGDERSVGGVLTRVQLGEADAGLVYVTDVLAAADVDGVPLRRPVQARYPAAVLRDAGDPAAARAFVELLAGDVGRSVLRELGFGSP